MWSTRIDTSRSLRSANTDVLEAGSQLRLQLFSWLIHRPDANPVGQLADEGDDLGGRLGKILTIHIW
jgi:hypothetical protein